MVMVTVSEAQFTRGPVALDPPLAFSLVDPAMEIKYSKMIFSMCDLNNLL